VLCGTDEVRKIELSDVDFTPLTNIYMALCAQKRAIITITPEIL